MRSSTFAASGSSRGNTPSNAMRWRSNAASLLIRPKRIRSICVQRARWWRRKSRLTAEYGAEVYRVASVIVLGRFTPRNATSCKSEPVKLLPDQARQLSHIISPSTTATNVVTISRVRRENCLLTQGKMPSSIAREIANQCGTNRKY
jgi:hypothetical protein